MERSSLEPATFQAPAVLLSGQVDYAMYVNFRQQLLQIPSEGVVVICLSTLGGDPEVARMMGEDVRLAQRHWPRSAAWFSSARSRSIPPEAPS